MDEREQLEQGIAALEQQRAVVGDATVAAAVAALRARMAALADGSRRVAPADLTGERKLVTVVFADISGFTALSEKLDPEEVRSLINDCFNVLVPVVERYGGVVDKFIGDEIMALFGAPVAHENDAERALRAALEMLEAIGGFNRRQGTQVGLHFGVETGTVVAGGLGSEGHEQYSVMGDAVNLAARLEDASAAGQILVGPHAYQLTSPLFDFEPLPPMRFKGKSALLTVHRLQGAKLAPGSLRGLAGLSSPMVGRDVELGCLLKAIRDLAGGHGKVLAITGEPGLGKSRLVAEARRAAADVRWAEGRALAYAQGVGYSVAQSMLDSLTGVSSGTPAVEAADELRRLLEQLLPGQSGELFPYLARLRGLPLSPDEEEALRHVLPEAVQQRVHRAFGQLVRALSRQQPVVLVWEDLHWADASSLALIESLGAVAEDMAVLHLLVFRPREGAIQDWCERRMGRGTDGEGLIDLVPLTDTESEHLIENLLRIENVPAATRQLILSKAEGNPFFLEELLRSLIETGLILVEGDRVVATREVEQLQVPDTLQGVVAARIDRLPTDDKRTIQEASVIGRVFQRPVLAYLLECERAGLELDRCLTHLQRQELIRAREEALEYIFKHAVTQDVTYHSLLVSRRKELHEMTAQALEALFPDQRDELCATLAYHYQKAELREPAVRYLTQAAERATRTYSNAEAIGFYRAAVTLAEGSAEQSARLQESLGEVLVQAGHGEEALAAYGAALELIPEERVIDRSRVNRKRGGAFMAMRRAADALSAFDAAEAAFGSELDPSDEARLTELLDIGLERAFALYWLNRSDELAALLVRLRPAAERHGTPSQRAALYQMIVGNAWRKELYVVSDQTLAYAGAALAAAVESGNKNRIAWETTMLGMCHLFRRELPHALTRLVEAREIADQIGFTEILVMVLAYLSVAKRMVRDVEASAPWLLSVSVWPSRARCRTTPGTPDRV